MSRWYSVDAKDIRPSCAEPEALQRFFLEIKAFTFLEVAVEGSFLHVFGGEEHAPWEEIDACFEHLGAHYQGIFRVRWENDEFRGINRYGQGKKRGQAMRAPHGNLSVKAQGSQVLAAENKGGSDAYAVIAECACRTTRDGAAQQVADELAETSARRIAAAWNACRELSVGALERDAVRQLIQAAEELIRAVQPPSNPQSSRAFDTLQEALRLIRGH